MHNLASVFPRLIPQAIAWAEARSLEIQKSGAALDAIGLRLARAAGVIEPTAIRVLVIRQMPLLDDPELLAVALQTGLMGPSTIGMTLGHSIYVIEGYYSNRLLSHECRHVYQYEIAGSIAAFLSLYLNEIAAYGYEDAPLEIDARRHERDFA